MVFTWREIRAGKTWAIGKFKSADYLQLTKTLILSTEVGDLFHCVWIARCSQQWWWLIYNVQCILDCLPVSVRTEPLYSDDQFAYSYSSPNDPYISDQNIIERKEDCLRYCSLYNVNCHSTYNTTHISYSVILSLYYMGTRNIFNSFRVHSHSHDMLLNI